MLVGALVASLLVLTGGVLAPASAAPVGVPPTGQGGTVTAWGNTENGLADVPTAPTGEQYTAIAGGGFHNLALTDQGNAVAWGNNADGQATVPAAPSGEHYTAIAGGWVHSLALTDQGTVVAWGFNGNGQTTVPAVPTGEQYTAIAAGAYHSLALTDQGTVVAWGYNDYGQTDVPAAPAGEEYTAIAAGVYHNLALTDQGTVVAWGYNDYGQIDVPAGEHYTAIAAGYTHSLALTDQGNVVAWGDNGDGEIDVPTAPSGEYYTAIAAGYAHGLAETDQGTVVAWGNNGYGQTNVPAAPSGERYTAIAAGGFHSLGITAPPPLPPAVSGVSPAAGPTAGGDVVTITGTGFTDATAVRLSRTPVTSYTVVSATEITATTPAHAAGTVNVRVTTGAGDSPVVTADRYVYRTAPVITAMSRTAGRLTGGETITITGTGFTGATAVSFGASPATSWTTMNSQRIVAVVPASATGEETTLHVTVTTPGGTTPTDPATSYSYRAAPTITGVTPTTGPTTGGETITITGTGFTGATGVKFSATTTSYTVDSPTQITATTPPHAAGTINIRVTNPGGPSPIVIADRYRYL